MESSPSQEGVLLPHAAGDSTVWSIRTILCATDLSDSSWRVLDLAAALARDQGARLVVLHVPVPPPFVRPGELAKILRQPGGYRRELEEQLHRFRPPGLGGRIDYRLEEGDPAVEILRAAEDAGCDLIVMGTHGRTGLDHLLMGSVAEKVVRRACCPVLTVRIPPETSSADPG
jgi:universal stress protein A